MKRLLGSLGIVMVVLLIGVVLVIYAQGKRLTRDGKLIDTGIIQVDTTPDNGNIYINGEYKDRSDNNIEELKPGNYTVKIEKDHYHTWEKVITVKKGTVTPIKVALFPSNPSLTAITFDGVFQPKLSPDGRRVVFGIQNSSKAGLWVLNLSDRQFFFSADTLRQIAKDNGSTIFSKSSLTWSSDSRSILAEVQITGSTEVKVFQLNADSDNNSLNDVTTRAETLKQQWATDLANSNSEKLKNFSKEVQDLATQVEKVTFSRDNSSVLLIKDDKTALVYDTKPTPIPNSKPQTYNLPAADQYFWFNGDSKHLVAIEENTISVLDSDGTNKFSIFTGDFDPNSVFGWPDGSRLVISINLNSKANPLPNLYTIGLR